MWRPEVAPSTLILNPAPTGFEVRLSIDSSALGPALVARVDQDGRGMSFADETGEVHARIQDDNAIRRPAILLPLDDMFELRLDVALHFVRRLRGESAELLPRILRLTPLQRSRLIQLLHAFDVHDTGGGPREVAAKVLISEQARLPSVEWKDSHARRKANRLIHDSIALVERGYLKLLRGG